jgi:bacterioferritin-associated ferredoxin
VIVCSCNVLSDGQVRSAIGSAASHARMSCVYASLGCVAKCGRCANTIKIILEEIGRFATTNNVAIEAAGDRDEPSEACERVGGLLCAITVERPRESEQKLKSGAAR